MWMNINSVKFKETHFPLLCKFSRQEVGSWIDIYTLPAYVDRLGGWARVTWVYGRKWPDCYSTATPLTTFLQSYSARILYSATTKATLHNCPTTFPSCERQRSKWISVLSLLIFWSVSSVQLYTVCSGCLYWVGVLHKCRKGIAKVSRKYWTSIAQWLKKYCTRLVYCTIIAKVLHKYCARVAKVLHNSCKRIAQ